MTESEYWKEQSEAWHREFGKMVDIRDRFVAELDATRALNEELLEALERMLKAAFVAELDATRALNAELLVRQAGQEALERMLKAFESLKAPIQPKAAIRKANGE
jgi:RNAse (barnase) inhibitor barstar